IEPYAAIYVAFAPARCLSGDHAMTDAECAHRFPGHLPEFLPRPPDGARPLHRGAQLRFVPRDPHPDKIVVVAPRSSSAGGPWTVRRQESNFLKRTGARASSAAS